MTAVRRGLTESHQDGFNILNAALLGILAAACIFSEEGGMAMLAWMVQVRGYPHRQEHCHD
jgi:hypothetical protein